MASELMEALEILEKEKDISKESILSAIENALVTAYKNQYKKKEDSILAAENVFAKVDEETGEFFVYAEKTVVDEIENGLLEISLEKTMFTKNSWQRKRTSQPVLCSALMIRALRSTSEKQMAS